MAQARIGGLVRQNLRRNLRHFALSAFGITVGIAAFVFFLGLSGGVKKVVLGDIFPIDQIEVISPRTTLLGEGKKISDDLVAAILARPEVAAAYPRLLMAFGAKGAGSIMGNSVYFELGGFLDGIDPKILESELGPGVFTDNTNALPGPACSEPSFSCPEDRYCDQSISQCRPRVPLIISRTVLEMYNGSFAPAHGLPKIGQAQEAMMRSQMKRMRLRIDLGNSYVSGHKGNAPSRVVEAVLVGISDKAKKMGMTVPIDVVRRWNQEYVGESAGRDYSSVVVRITDKNAVGPFVSWIRSQGFETEDNQAETFSWAILIVTSLFLGIALLIVGLSAVNIAHTFFMLIGERRRELGILRAVGATRGTVRLMILFEAACLGVGSGVVGVAAGVGVGKVADLLAARLLPDFPFKPDTYFFFPPWLLGVSLVFAVLACMCGAWLPATRASRMAPASALAG